MTVLRFVVPGVPPSVNSMYRRFTNRRGRRMNVIKREAEQWMELAAIKARLAAQKTGWQRTPAGTKVVVRLWFWWPNGQRRDTHNTLKGILDSWEGVLYEDDKDALPRIMDYGVDRKNPRIEVEVTLADEGRAAG